MPDLQRARTRQSLDKPIISYPTVSLGARSLQFQPDRTGEDGRRRGPTGRAERLGRSMEVDGSNPELDQPPAGAGQPARRRNGFDREHQDVFGSCVCFNLWTK